MTKKKDQIIKLQQIAENNDELEKIADSIKSGAGSHKRATVKSAAKALFEKLMPKIIAAQQADGRLTYSDIADRLTAVTGYPFKASTISFWIRNKNGAGKSAKKTKAAAAEERETAAKSDGQPAGVHNEANRPPLSNDFD